MIFVTLGSQKFQFNRLIKEIDRLIEKGKISEEVFAQVGYSDYKPKNYEYKSFLDRDEFADIMSKCDKVITHGGTGAIITAVKKNKKVIAVPRLAKYDEHVDDHQLQIINKFSMMNLIVECNDVEKLIDSYYELNEKRLTQYKSNTSQIIKSIESFIYGEIK